MSILGDSYILILHIDIAILVQATKQTKVALQVWGISGRRDVPQTI
ncbi:hypothetical protein [Pseudanabaena sp. UWO310]|nr:hypothetical protein [Pseudanabaena sp. UWO310]